MDALSFVMGERAATLRVKHTRDLIHGAHIGKPVSTTASVTMRYCDDNGEELNFCRSISGELDCIQGLVTIDLFHMRKQCYLVDSCHGRPAH